ncbi:hypothetical protein [Mangrovibacterium diazotrophicum]|uniref:Uncharacterized protein n=1 Tax=Mangrovibacterium diazotrophicum TaxID=1261403 RepID=A0A419VX04_9BACT|nr:hypothetical protein [Mangrovibacterium diazotrophicum]RKD87763.1 hypothetical protein BC643_3770 [Mangrovibacterium diazotrophicum]
MKRTEKTELDAITNEINAIKNRLTQIEQALQLKTAKERSQLKVDESDDDSEFELNLTFAEKGNVESRIGEYGLAWLGNIVLLFGISFLVQYLKDPLLSAIVGFASVGLIYAASYYSRKPFAYLSKLFGYSGHLLLFYVSLQLHFFTETPLINSKTLGTGLLLIVVCIQIYWSIRKQKATLSFLALLMLLFTGIVNGSIAFAAFITMLTSVIALYIYIRFGRQKLVLAFMFIIYLAHTNWLLNNPLIGNPLELAASPGISYLCFLMSAIAFSALAVIPPKETASRELLIASVVWNGLNFSVVLAFSTLLYFRDSYILLFSFIAAFCLAYSIILQKRTEIKLFASMYAIYSFVAMSVAFYGLFLLPKAYTLLSIQSLLVVSMALWFRSRFIVVINTFLFLLLLALYLSDEQSYNGTNFSFMLIAFFSARIINWKKDRLQLKTELIRNVYLLAGWIMTLISLFHIVPDTWITASWIFAAILFFATSLLLKNIKYRWLAIASVLASACKLIFVDFANIDIVFRILLFMALAVVSLGTSILYTKFYKSKKTES